MLYFENITSSPFKVGFSNMFARATQEFQASLGHLESKFSKIMMSNVSIESFWN